MISGLTVPPDVLWKLALTLTVLISTAYGLLLHTVWRVGGKVNRTDCLGTHAELGEQLVGMAKDIEYLVRQNGGQPAPKPSNGGGRHKARDPREPQEDE